MFLTKPNLNLEGPVFMDSVFSVDEYKILNQEKFYTMDLNKYIFLRHESYFIHFSISKVQSWKILNISYIVTYHQSSESQVQLFWILLHKSQHKYFHTANIIWLYVVITAFMSPRL